jgi:N-acetylglucosamine transport system substrate-binding protein
MRVHVCMTRRAFLRSALLTVAGGALAGVSGCVVTTPVPAAPTPEPATPTVAAGPTAAVEPTAAEAAAAPVELPELGIEIATEAVDPLNIEKEITVDGVFFAGGYGADYIRYAAQIFEEVHPKTKVDVVGIQRVADQLRPRFIGGNPPDVIDNSGAGSLDTVALVNEGQLLDLAPLMDAPALDTPGKTFRETLFAGSQDTGVYEGTQFHLNIAYTVVGLWHSQSLFETKGWEYPQTWGEMLAFCEAVKNEGEMSPWTYQGKYPGYMVWGAWFPLIYKIAGMAPLRRIDNLEEGCFQQPEVMQATEMVYELAAKGYIMPGTEGLTHTEAQAEWLQGKAVFIPCGSWLENEMKTITPEGFDMVVKPVPAVEGGQGSFEALMTASGETYFVPSKAQHPRAGMEFLRILLSKVSAKYFAEEVSSMMPVIGGTEGATLSPGMQSAVAAAEAAGDETFPFPFYGGVSQVSTEADNRMGELLTMRITPAEFVEAMQRAADEALANPDITVIKRYED